MPWWVTSNFHCAANAKKFDKKCDFLKCRIFFNNCMQHIFHVACLYVRISVSGFILSQNCPKNDDHSSLIRMFLTKKSLSFWVAGKKIFPV